LIGSRLVAGFGGANVAGIRPLYFVGLAVTVGTFILVSRQLSDCRYAARRAASNLFKDLGQVLKEGRSLKRWLVVASITQLPLGMIFPFAPLFAHQFKGADPYVLGAMAAGAALTSIVMAIPLGRLADRVGRKKVLYLAIPLFWVSNIMLLLAPSPGFLIAAGVLQGFYHISAPITGAIERELVPAGQMGRWLGITRFVKMLFNACLAFLSGLIWDRLGPQYVFLTFIALDLFLRMPLLISMPETLGLREGKAERA
ncbi:MAG: MFS transporter, partial [Chloroflexota bacterium]